MVLTDTTPSPTSCQYEKESLENDTPIESSACGDVKEKTFDLLPVPPFASGEGLPYAPEGWPNPDDIWSWKVGRRSNKSGYFHDRYLYLPKSLQKPPRKGEIFQSKPDVIRYLESNFPDMKIEAFFAMFSWKVLSTEAKAVRSLSSSSPVDLLETGKTAIKKIGVQEKLKRKVQHRNQPIRKSSRLVNARTRFLPVQGADEIIDLSTLDEEAEIESSMERFPLVVQGADEIVDLCTLNKEAELESSMYSKGSSDSELDQRPSSTGDGQPENSSVAVCDFIDSTEGSGMQTATEESSNETIIGTFGDYLDTLEDILVLPHTKTSLSEPMVTGTTPENEMTECKKKLSSFLAMDFCYLVSCDNLKEVARLASQLRKDPSLSIDQLIKLKLVEEIPLISDIFLEAQKSIQEADNFLADIEAKKLKATSLKNSYNELKNKIALVDAEKDKTSLAIQEIDDQIMQLQSKRIEMCRAMVTMQKRKVELISSQESVDNSIPTIVAEIKLLNSEKPKWELKKANYAKRVAEIHERFMTLRGLTF